MMTSYPPKGYCGPGPGASVDYTGASLKHWENRLACMRDSRVIEMCRENEWLREQNARLMDQVEKLSIALGEQAYINSKVVRP